MRFDRDKKAFFIFDMDGVLIDVSGSYREVVRKTVLVYLKDVLGISVQDENWITLKDIDLIKKSGGLNNDWDLTYTILNAVLGNFFDSENIDIVKEIKERVTNRSEEEILDELKTIRCRFNTGVIEKGIVRENLFEVYREFNNREKSAFLFNDGDVGTGNVIKRIFQEVYLGKDLFEKIYNRKAIFYTESEGLIKNERLIPDYTDLKKLEGLALLGIATGRPDVEAIYAVNRFNIKNFFATIVTEDDISREEKRVNAKLRKPNPFIIEQCLVRTGWEDKNRVYYIGDMPDDIEASKKAGVVPVGFVCTRGKEPEDIQKHVDLLRDRGAFTVLTRFKDVFSLFR